MAILRPALAALNALLDIVADPPAVARTLNAREPRIDAALFLLVAILWMAATWLETTMTLTVVRSAMSAHQLAHAAPYLGAMIALTTLASPIALSLRVLLATFLMWLTAIALGIDLSFKRFFSYVSAAQVILIMAKFVSAIAVHLTGSVPLHGLQPIGLNLLLPDDALGRNLGGLVNPFSLWFVVVCVVGVVVLGKVRVRQASYAVLSYVCAVVLWAAGNIAVWRAMGIQ
jgi:hypothetical protein